MLQKGPCNKYVVGIYLMLNLLVMLTLDLISTPAPAPSLNPYHHPHHHPRLRARRHLTSHSPSLSTLPIPSLSSQGMRLDPSVKGVVVTNGALHDEIISALKEAAASL